MPRRPANWLDGEISLRMEKLEADFLREHVARVRPKDRAEPSLIARLARLEMVPPSDMFDDAVLAVAGADCPALVRADKAACLAGNGGAIYDALLERNVVEHDGRKDTAQTGRASWRERGGQYV